MLAPDHPYLITEAEIRASSSTDVYTLVQDVHPMWLQERGAKSLYNDVDIVVYLHNAQAGVMEMLRQVETTSVRSIAATMLRLRSTDSGRDTSTMRSK